MKGFRNDRQPKSVKIGAKILVGSIWEREQIPNDCRELVFVQICKKRDKCSYGIHRQIGLVSIVFKLLPSIILCRLSHARKNCMVENQTGFPPVWGCVDRIFTLRQILGPTSCSIGLRYLSCIITGFMVINYALAAFWFIMKEKHWRVWLITQHIQVTSRVNMPIHNADGVGGSSKELVLR